MFLTGSEVLIINWKMPETDRQTFPPLKPPQQANKPKYYQNELQVHSKFGQDNIWP